MQGFQGHTHTQVQVGGLWWVRLWGRQLGVSAVAYHCEGKEGRPGEAGTYDNMRPRRAEARGGGCCVGCRITPEKWVSALDSKPNH
jgi:hypothetical protein